MEKTRKKLAEQKAARDQALVRFYEMGRVQVAGRQSVFAALRAEGLAAPVFESWWELSPSGRVVAYETYVEVKSREQLVGQFGLAAECADEIMAMVAANASFAIDQRDSKDYEGLKDSLYAYLNNVRVTVVEMGHRPVLSGGFDTFGLFRVFARQEARKIGLSLAETCCE